MGPKNFFWIALCVVCVEPFLFFLTLKKSISSSLSFLIKKSRTKKKKWKECDSDFWVLFSFFWVQNLPATHHCRRWILRPKVFFFFNFFFFFRDGKKKTKTLFTVFCFFLFPPHNNVKGLTRIQATSTNCLEFKPWVSQNSVKKKIK